MASFTLSPPHDPANIIHTCNLKISLNIFIQLLQHCVSRCAVPGHARWISFHQIKQTFSVVVQIRQYAHKSLEPLNCADGFLMGFALGWRWLAVINSWAYSSACFLCARFGTYSHEQTVPCPPPASLVRLTLVLTADSMVMTPTNKQEIRFS